jgi:hypothetical protein
MPKGLKETSSLIVISANISQSVPNAFETSKVDMQLNPLDNEVFIVYGIDLDVGAPDLLVGTLTDSRLSVSTTARTSVGGINNSNVLAQSKVVIQELGGAAAVTQFSSDSAPSTRLEYLGIISTNDFFINIDGNNNVNAVGGNVRLYGVRAKADSSIYAALVQSEVLSA